MDMIVSIFFFVFAFICMIFALYEERDTNNVDDSEETKSDNLIVILLASAIVMFFVSCVCMIDITSSYYSITLDSMVTVHQTQYGPLGYVPLGFAFLAIILIAAKAFQMLDRSRNES
jgi:membrane-associated HD superfamily phosphohydrolase